MTSARAESRPIGESPRYELIRRLVVALLLAGILPFAQVASAERPARSGSGPTTQIVGGHPVPAGADAFMAHVRITLGPQVFGCGGTVIDPTHVLTAAHCATAGGSEALDASSFDVTIGSTVLSEAGPGSEFAVSEVTVHPDYDQFTHAHDAAVLTLAEPVTDPNIDPIALVAVGSRDARRGTKAKVAGWGLRAFNDPGSASDHLRVASLKVTGFKTCRKAYRGTESRPAKATMLCAYGKGRDACQGDSGGPIFVRTAAGPVQIGITSFGIGCAFDGIPGVYTRLSDPSIGGFVRDAIASP